MRALARVGLILYLAFLIFGLSVTPRALGDLLQRGELPQARLTRERVGERLGALRDRFFIFASEVDDLRLRVEKIRVAYGLAEALEPSPRLEDRGAFPDTVFLAQIEDTVRVATRLRLDIGDLEAKVANLREFESGEAGRVAFTPSISPLRGDFVLTSAVGQRKNPFTGISEYHSGIDLSAPVGSSILAAADGEVVFAGRYSLRRRSGWWRLGKLVAVRHGKELLSIYGHCDKIMVRRGQRVTRGDRLATVGESGVSANPHLHYAVWRRNDLGVLAPVDPRLFMLDRRWSDEEALLVQASSHPEAWQYEALPRGIR